MNLSYEELSELLRKAAVLDIIINYLKLRGAYATVDDVLAIAGEPLNEKKESENVLRF